MKKKYLLISLLILISVSVFAQKRNKGDNAVPGPAISLADSLYHYNQLKYNTALKYGDAEAAKSALYSMLVLKPSETHLKDSLAHLYFSRNAYVQTILLGKEIIESNPAKATILELVAISEQAIGAVKESLKDYEKLFALTKSPFHLYQVASLQYTMKRYGECSASIDRILMHPEAVNEKISISLAEGQSQQVPLAAAAHNMKGVILMELNKGDVAREHFKKAIELAPDFILASNNIEAMNKPEEVKK